MTRAIRAAGGWYSAAVGGLLVRTLPNVPIRSHRRFSALGVFGGVFGFSVFGTAVTLHGEVEPVSMFTHFVSALGWGPNGSHEAFKFGLTALGLVLLPYVLFLIARLRHCAEECTRDATIRATERAASCWVAGVVGLFLLAWFIDIREPSFQGALLTLSIHLVGAVTYFVCSVVGTMQLTQAMGLAGMKNTLQRYLVVFMMLCTVGMVLSLVQLLVAANDMGIVSRVLAEGTQFSLGVEERVQLIANVTSASPLTPFFEWMVVLAMLVWFVVTGIQTFFAPADSAASS